MYGRTFHRANARNFRNGPDQPWPFSLGHLIDIKFTPQKDQAWRCPMRIECLKRLCILTCTHSYMHELHATAVGHGINARRSGFDEAEGISLIWRSWRSICVNVCNLKRQRSFALMPATGDFLLLETLGTQAPDPFKLVVGLLFLQFTLVLVILFSEFPIFFSNKLLDLRCWVFNTLAKLDSPCFIQCWSTRCWNGLSWEYLSFKPYQSLPVPYSFCCFCGVSGDSPLLQHCGPMSQSLYRIGFQ